MDCEALNVGEVGELVHRLPNWLLNAIERTAQQEGKNN